MFSPKKQDFWPKINILERNFLEKGEDCKLDGFFATKMGVAGLILKNNTTFEDIQMILKLFFGFRFSKISVGVFRPYL